MTIQEDVQKLEPGALVELFVLDATDQTGEVLRFHQDTNFGSIWWQGVEYFPWPIKVEGFAKTTDKPPTPSLTIGNIDGSISALCRVLDDLAGVKIIRKRTFARYIDARNFPGPNLVPNASFTSGTTGFTFSGGTGIVEGDGLRITRTTANIGVGRNITGLTVGKKYVVNLDIADNSVPVSNMAFIRVGSSISNSGVKSEPIPQFKVGRVQAEFTATATNHWVSVWVNSPNARLVLRRFAVQEFGVNPEADPNQQFADELWYVERKVTENKELVEFELASPLDLNGVQLPRRQIVANYCSWMSLGGYRGANCGYTGPPVADANDVPTDDPTRDACSGRISGCKIRKWPGDVLNFGGFPAAGLMRT